MSTTRTDVDDVDRLALDERQISYLQGTIQMVLQAEVAEQIQQRLMDLGITPTVKDI